MLRRGTNFVATRAVLKQQPAGAQLAVTAAATATVAQRTYVGPMDPFCSMFMCFFVTAAGASWGNNAHSLLKHGIWRHTMAIDSSFVVEGCRTWKYIGGFLGFLMYWYVVGPMKYRHSKNMDQWAKRFGNTPF